jgi:hypothetical protein
MFILDEVIKYESGCRHHGVEKRRAGELAAAAGDERDWGCGRGDDLVRK